MDKSALEKKLSHQSYQTIESELKYFSDEELVRLLDSKSIKVGDTAFSLLSRNNKLDLVADRLLDGTLHTKLGKIRATNMCCGWGKRFKRSVDVFLALLQEINPDVLGNALFGLVFLQDKANLPAIRAEAKRRAADDEGRRRLLRAIKAIEKNDPFIYSPHFQDNQGVWELDPIRFPRGAAPSVPSDDAGVK